MTDKAYAVPLHELLAGVPRNARLVIDDPDGMGTQFIPVGRMCHEAAEALRARLAQPEPEPVAWGVPNTRPTEKAQFMMLLHSPDGCQYPEQLVPLYTAPPQREWVGLTDKDCEWCDEHSHGNTSVAKQKAYGRAIEAKLKEKNNG